MGLFVSVLVNQLTDHSGGVSRGTVNDRQQVTCDKKTDFFFTVSPISLVCLYTWRARYSNFLCEPRAKVRQPVPKLSRSDSRWQKLPLDGATDFLSINLKHNMIVSFVSALIFVLIRKPSDHCSFKSCWL